MLMMEPLRPGRTLFSGAKFAAAPDRCPLDLIRTLRTTTYRAHLVVHLLARDFEDMRHYNTVAACLLSVRHTDRT